MTVAAVRRLGIFPRPPPSLNLVIGHGNQHVAQDHNVPIVSETSDPVNLRAAAGLCAKQDHREKRLVTVRDYGAKGKLPSFRMWFGDNAKTPAYCLRL